MKNGPSILHPSERRPLNSYPHPPNSYISVVGPHTHTLSHAQNAVNITHADRKASLSVTHTQHHLSHTKADSVHSKQHMFSFAKQASPSFSDQCRTIPTLLFQQPFLHKIEGCMSDERPGQIQAIIPLARINKGGQGAGKKRKAPEPQSQKNHHDPMTIYWQ